MTHFGFASLRFLIVPLKRTLWGAVSVKVKGIYQGPRLKYVVHLFALEWIGMIIIGFARQLFLNVR